MASEKGIDVSLGYLCYKKTDLNFVFKCYRKTDVTYSVLFRCTYKKYYKLLLPNNPLPCLPVIGFTYKQKNTPDYKPNPSNVLKWIRSITT